MTIFEFKLPDLGEGVVTSEIVELNVKVGQMVAEDDVLIGMMTDKATVELPSPVDGKIISIAGDVGDIINVGTVLFTFETDAEQAAIAPETSQQEPPKSQTTSQPNPDVLASPSLRRRAMDLDVDLLSITGTGPSGRLKHEDLDNLIAATATKNSEITEIPLRGVRRKIAEAMEFSKRNIPHYTYVEEVDLTELEKLRAQLNADRTPDQPKLTLLPFLIKAMVKAVAKFPQCNSHYNQETNIISQFAAAHIGMATNTPTGLMVPVIKHAEAMDIWQYAEKILDLAEKARTGKASRDELSGSTISITSLGKIGGLVSTPIINAPETCIIGINKLIDRPMAIDCKIIIRKMMNISGSFDHRIVDGYDGATMIQYIKDLLETPITLFIDNP
ncbi:MAG: branched-chain alpha-keto acid dehydrogenase subunit E2 [Hyphomicrobiales bacterium]|nr:MAG: branched-chain alpha-keto acid dehydrogenase subunit E2 [Hyphomicrobiales bacterium]